MKNQKFIGKTVEILVENRSKKGIEHQYWGKTRTNKVVVFVLHNGYDEQKNDKLIGQLVDIRIQRVDAYTLYGEFIHAKIR